MHNTFAFLVGCLSKTQWHKKVPVLIFQPAVSIPQNNVEKFLQAKEIFHLYLRCVVVEMICYFVCL